MLRCHTAQAIEHRTYLACSQLCQFVQVSADLVIEYEWHTQVRKSGASTVEEVHQSIGEENNKEASSEIRKLSSTSDVG